MIHLEPNEEQKEILERFTLLLEELLQLSRETGIGIYIPAPDFQIPLAEDIHVFCTKIGKLDLYKRYHNFLMELFRTQFVPFKEMPHYTIITHGSMFNVEAVSPDHALEIIRENHPELLTNMMAQPGLKEIQVLGSDSFVISGSPRLGDLAMGFNWAINNGYKAPVTALAQKLTDPPRVLKPHNNGDLLN